MAPSSMVVAAACGGAGVLAGWFLRSFFRAAAVRATRMSYRSREGSLASESEGDWTDDEVGNIKVHV